MSDVKISAILAMTLMASPLSLLAIPTSSSAQTSSAISSVTSPSPRLSVRRMKHQLAEAPRLKSEPMGTYVGELQEKWKFPSDHLPIGMAFENLNIGSWNVLDAAYMNWVIEKNSQGLSRSMIADEHSYSSKADEEAKLTLRDRQIAEKIILMTLQQEQFNIIALQECSQPLLEALRSRLKDRGIEPSLPFEIVSSPGNTLLLDSRRFELIDAKERAGIFSADPDRTIQEVLVRRLDNGELLRVVNAHLPGDPNQPGRSDFAAYLQQTFEPTLTTVVMGDMNFNELEMAGALADAFQNQSPFSIYSPYCTNISPYTFKSKAIDHFFVYSPKSSPVVLKAPDQVVSGSTPMAFLLHGIDFSPSTSPRSFRYFSYYGRLICSYYGIESRGIRPRCADTYYFFVPKQGIWEEHRNFVMPWGGAWPVNFEVAQEIKEDLLKKAQGPQPQ